MNINLSRREKILILTAAITAIVLLGFKFLILPAADEYTINAAKLAESSMDVNTVKIQQADAKGIEEQLKNEYDETNAVASPLLPPIDKPSLNVWLVNIAKGSGLTVNSVEISDPVAANPGVPLSKDGGGKTDNSSTSSEIEYNLKTYAEIAKGTATPSQIANANASSSKPSKSSSEQSNDAEMVTVKLTAAGSYQNVKYFLDAIKDTKKYIVVNSFDFSGKEDNLTFNIKLECYGAEKLTDDDTFKWELPAPSGQQDIM
ncbi:hypothetical protein V6C21_00900 [[Clostridium] cellulosi]|jgi:hypothetical protein|nr:MAG: hypothetical protein DIU81_05170 [[Clostridium] cellulosi]